MAHTQTPFLIFLALLLSSTSLVYAIRPQKQNSETSSVFSLPLHPRDSLTNLQNQNFTARTISRLEGDTARVKYINSRLRNTLFNSDDPNFQLEAVQSSPLSSFSGGGYVARMGVGQPVQEFDMLADTGSDINWFQCESCMQCYPQSGQKFDPTKSSTYQRLSCSSEQCNALSRRTCSDTDTCIYMASYGGGALASKSSGEFGTETFSFGSSGSTGNVALGCGLDNEGHLSGIAGILGLGFSQIALPSQIQATSFSYCLVGGDSQSSSTLEFNSAPPDDSAIVPLSTQDSFVYYYVELSGITVGEDQIPIPPSVYQIGSDGTGGIIIDSGTTITFLNSDVYNSVRDAFTKYTQNSAPFRFENFETCYDVPSGSASRFYGPSMSLQFSNGQSTPALGPDNYLFRAADSTFCLAFTPSDSNDVVSILGNVQQRGMRITYDLDKKLIGFSPKKC